MSLTILPPNERNLIEQLIAELKRKNEERIPDFLVSCAEAARYLGCSTATISAYIKQGRLSKRTIDGVTGISIRQLMNTKKKNRREPGEPRKS